MRTRIVLLLLLVFASSVLSAQTTAIFPDEKTEFCPFSDIRFSVTLPRIANNTVPKVYAWTNNPVLVSGVSNLVSSGSNTTFTFVGRFRDVNIAQGFRIEYSTDATTSRQYDPMFKYIKSLYYTTSCAQVPDRATIQVPRCQVVNIPVNVANVKWGTSFESPTLCFGSISTFEYLLPIGWSIGASTSDGTRWIPGGNSVTVTSNASNGHGGAIYIRPRNNCGSGLANNQPPGRIPISRPTPPLSIDGNDVICSGSSNYSISGPLPPGTTVCWQISSPTGAASIPSASYCGLNLPVTFNGVGSATITATITDCVGSYTLAPKDIVLGTPAVNGFLVDGDRFDYSINGPGRYYTVCPSEGLDVFPNIPTGMQGVIGVLEHSWQYVSGSAQVFHGGNYYGAYVYTSPAAGVQVNLRYRYRNACGWSGFDNISIFTMNCDRGEEPYRPDINSFDFTFSPNPATNNINMSLRGLTAEYEVRIFEMMTSSLVKFLRFDKTQQQVAINIASLKAGSYAIQVRCAGATKSRQLRVVR